MLAALGPAAAAQRQFDDFLKRSIPRDFDVTKAVALGDVDGDGDTDIVFANGHLGLQQQTRLHLNNGNGEFTDATNSRLPTFVNSTSAVALGDVDNDGDLDMVLGNDEFFSRGQQNRLYLNDGTGKFINVTPARMPPDTDRTTSIALGDVDGDGDLDIVFGNRGDPTRLYLNNGAGNFADRTPGRLPAATDGRFIPPPSDETSSVVLVDVDRDGDLDLIAGLSGGRQSRMYVNDGTGAFTDVSERRLPSDASKTRAIAAGDVDGDGDPDLVFGVAGQNRLFLNDGTGHYRDRTATRMPVDGDPTSGVVMGDVDGDGDLDLVLSNRYEQRNRVYVNDGAGHFTDETQVRLPADSDFTQAAGLADVDGDSDLDLVFANGDPDELTNRQNTLYLNSGTGSFNERGPRSRLPTDADRTKAIATGDVDGDGDVDVVFGNGDTTGEQNRLYINDGLGEFTDETAARLPVAFDLTKGVAMGDVDGDGDLDLVVANGHYAAGQQNRLYLNDGTGVFSDVSAARMPFDADISRAVALADVDGDTDLDIVFANTLTRSRLYLNDGTGVFFDASALRLPDVPGRTYALEFGDVDGDNDLDLVFANAGAIRQNQLYLNDGTGTFVDVTQDRMPADTNRSRSMAMGDVDGDGDLDLLFGNNGNVYTGEQNTLYLNDGNGAFTDGTPGRMPIDTKSTWSMILADIDSDGDRDLVLGNFGARYPSPGGELNQIYVNDGTGTFVDVSIVRLPDDFNPTSAMALADTDGDGDLDLVLGNDATPPFYPPNRLYVNLHRHLEAPSPPRVGRSYRLEPYSRYGPSSLLHVAFPFIAPNTAVVPFPPLGTMRLLPTQILALPSVFIPQPSGLGSTAIPIPNQANLVGTFIHAQAIIVRDGLASRLTNLTSGLVMP